MVKRRASSCGDLLDFEEVRRRLQLGTRTDIGTHEIAIDQIIGSVSRVQEFDACFRPRTKRLAKLLDQIKAARPDAADMPILVYQVDHAYFVVDGHKRLALAVEEGRKFIDAEVNSFPSRFHVARGTTMDEIRATEMERRFRQTTGLDVGVPDARFPLSNGDCYLELSESVKAHAYDYSRSLERVVDPAESSRHWFDTVFRPAVEVARSSGIARVLSSASDPELFLEMRRGILGPMEWDWQIPKGFAGRAIDNLRRADPGPVPTALARITKRGRKGARVLGEGHDSADQSASMNLAEPDDAEPRQPAARTTIMRRPRRRADAPAE
jgi:hypothetical protein